MNKSFSPIARYFSVVAIAILIAAFLPFNVLAAVPTLTIKEVKPGESVTIHGSHFPAYIDFTTRMDKVGNLAIGGIVVGTIHSGTGSFDATFKIPASLINEPAIAIRMDGAGGWYSYTWFTNKPGATTATTTPMPTSVISTGSKPLIDVIGVKANDRITIQARNFPANQKFQIRIGTFANFFKDYVIAGFVNSGSGGNFQFTVDLPSMKPGVDRFTIRLDSPQKYYAFNVFKNVTSGTIGTVTTPIPTTVGGTCQIISTSPTTRLSPGEDFDAVWKIKNTGSSNWNRSEVDYKFISGSRLYKYEDIYDLDKTVKPGETVTITIDMTAPGKVGTYAMNWAVKRGSSTLCTLPLIITVR